MLIEIVKSIHECMVAVANCPCQKIFITTSRKSLHECFGTFSLQKIVRKSPLTNNVSSNTDDPRYDVVDRDGSMSLDISEVIKSPTHHCLRYI